MEKNQAIMEVMDRRKSIFEKRKAADEYFVTAKNDKRSLTDQEENRVQGIQDEIDREERELDMFCRLNAISKDDLAQSPGIKPETTRRTEEEEASEKRAIFLKYIRTGALSQGEERAIVENTTGLYLVPQDMDSQIVASVGQINSFRKYAGVRTTTRDKIVIPKMADVIAGWGKLETGSAPTEDTPTPSQKTIYVEDLNLLIKLGRDELMDTDANLEAAITERVSMATANKEAAGFSVGRGHTTYLEPEGVAIDSTIIASYKANWTTADILITDDMLKAEYYLGSQYLSGPGVAWMMHRKTEYDARKYRQAVASGYYGIHDWAPGLNGAPNQFDSYPIFNQDDMNYPADATDGINIIFGNFRLGYRIVDRMGMSVLRLNELYAEAGMVGFLFTKRVGGAVVLPEAFYGIYNDS